MPRYIHGDLPPEEVIARVQEAAEVMDFCGNIFRDAFAAAMGEEEHGFDPLGWVEANIDDAEEAIDDDGHLAQLCELAALAGRTVELTMRKLGAQI